MKNISEEEIRERLRKAIEQAGSLRKFAAQAEVSPAYVSQVMMQKNKASPKLLRAIGIEKIVTLRNVA